MRSLSLVLKRPAKNAASPPTLREPSGAAPPEGRPSCRTPAGRESGIARCLATSAGLALGASLAALLGLAACSSSKELITGAGDGPGDAVSGSAPVLAQCADAETSSFGQADCAGGGAGTGGYACQSSMSCKRVQSGQPYLLSREPDEVRCETSTGLCTALFYGSGSQIFNPEESGFLFGTSCFGACGTLAYSRNPFAAPTCLACFGLFARHWDVVGDAQRAHYVLGMHVMSGRYIPHLGQGRKG